MKTETMSFVKLTIILVLLIILLVLCIFALAELTKIIEKDESNYCYEIDGKYTFSLGVGECVIDTIPYDVRTDKFGEYYLRRR